MARIAGRQLLFWIHTVFAIATLLAVVISTPAEARRGFITDRNSNVVSVIETDTDQVVATLTSAQGIVSEPHGMAIAIDPGAPTDTPPPSWALAPGFDTGNATGQISLINTANNQVVPPQNFGGSSPRMIAVNPANGMRAYVANSGSGNVRILDLDLNIGLTTAGGEIPIAVLGATPWGVALSPDGKTLWVSDGNSTNVSKVDPDNPNSQSTVTVGSAPRDLGMLPNGNALYVANRDSNTVSVINTKTDQVTASVNVGTQPIGLAVSPDGKFVYVANNGANTVSVIDTTSNAVVATIPGLGSGPYDIGITPDSQYLYVTNNNAGTVSKVRVWEDNTGFNYNVTGTINLGTPRPRHIAIVPNLGPTASFTSSGGGGGDPANPVNPSPPSDGGGGGGGNTGGGTNTSQAQSVTSASQVQSSNSGTTVSFDGTQSSDPDGSIGSYDWDFGDGSTQNKAGATVSHTYTTPGSYTASLKVTDNEGCQGGSYTGQTLACAGSEKYKMSKSVTIPPNTTIVGSPTTLSNSGSSTFTFSSDDSGATFECKLDSGSYSACTSPHTVSGLADGPHTLSVRAVDSKSNADATPASFSWTVDTIAPLPEVQIANTDTSSGRPVTFMFTSSETGTTFECELDGGGWLPCTSPVELASLSAGTHTFRVRAVDVAGNYSSPVTYTWESAGSAYAPNWTFSIAKNLRSHTLGVRYGVSSDSLNLQYANLVLPRGIHMSLKRAPRCKATSSSKARRGKRYTRLGTVYFQYSGTDAIKRGLRHCGRGARSSGAKSLGSFVTGKSGTAADVAQRIPQVASMSIQRKTRKLQIATEIPSSTSIRRVGVQFNGKRYHWLRYDKRLPRRPCATISVAEHSESATRIYNDRKCQKITKIRRR